MDHISLIPQVSAIRLQWLEVAFGDVLQEVRVQQDLSEYLTLVILILRLGRLRRPLLIRVQDLLWNFVSMIMLLQIFNVQTIGE